MSNGYLKNTNNVNKNYVANYDNKNNTNNCNNANINKNNGYPIHD
jgi:hypothetical protein